MRPAGATRHVAPSRKLAERFDRPCQAYGRFSAANRSALSAFDLWRRKLHAAAAAVEEERLEALFV